MSTKRFLIALAILSLSIAPVSSATAQDAAEAEKKPAAEAAQ